MKLRRPVFPPSGDECHEIEDVFPGYYNLDPPFAFQPELTGIHPISNNRTQEEFRVELQKNINTPAELLILAAMELLTPGNESELRSNIFTDLALTGSLTSANLYSSGKFEKGFLRKLLVKHLRATNFFDEPLTNTQIKNQVNFAIDQVMKRAIKVSWALRGWGNRDALGYIAVSAEDDTPFLPVNVPGPSINNGPLIDQYHMTVRVSATKNNPPITVKQVRFCVYGNRDNEISMETRREWVDAALHLNRLSPRVLTPILNREKGILLYIHGHSSRLEEANDLVPHLLEKGYQVLVMDLPGSGYSSRIAPDEIGPLTDESNVHRIATSGPYRTLEFLEQFIVDFIEQLQTEIGFDIKSNIKGIIGGSLGGNLGLRLSQRGLNGFRYLHTIISWSPASTWGQSWARARLLTLGFGTYFNIIKYMAVQACKDRALEIETVNSRYNYIAQVFGKFQTFEENQSERWYRNSWQPCKTNYQTRARFDREEIYNSLFRLWHWRLAYEQLIFMHEEEKDPASYPRFRDIQSRVLLGAGSEDNQYPDKLQNNTRRLASKMINVSGSTLWLNNTGHSIHNERPKFLANEIHHFINPRQSNAEDKWSAWTALGNKQFHPKSISWSLLDDGRLQVYGIEKKSNQIQYSTALGRNKIPDSNWKEITSGVPSAGFKGKLTIEALKDGKLRMYAQRRDRPWITHLTYQNRWHATNIGSNLRQFIGRAKTGPVVISRVRKSYSLLTGNRPQRTHLIATTLCSGRTRIREQPNTKAPIDFWWRGKTLGNSRFDLPPIMARNHDGRIAIFNVDQSGRVMHIWERNQDKWIDEWRPLGSKHSDGGCTVVRSRDGRLFVFIVGLDRAVWYCHQTVPNNSWSEWLSLGGTFANGATPTAVVDFQGDIVVAARSLDSIVYLKRLILQTGTWLDWKEIDGVIFDDPVAINMYNGNIGLIAIGIGNRFNVTVIKN